VSSRFAERFLSIKIGILDGSDAGVDRFQKAEGGGGGKRHIGIINPARERTCSVSVSVLVQTLGGGLPFWRRKWIWERESRGRRSWVQIVRHSWAVGGVFDQGFARRGLC
jgi:hypothetical protein